ncbi:hypothetical protein Aph01nite_32510 [Acrocarpospora phusangensis]|uniref:Uncharacterized protein n=1 Tax=Acrocarpospora phusangensis TaxID=1070424 RepID=A0A919Q9Z3_9ACTN|nr:hypothetical protein Aph01nite_32510 [Acrocarpospora phusangensis]
MRWSAEPKGGRKARTAATVPPVIRRRRGSGAAAARERPVRRPIAPSASAAAARAMTRWPSGWTPSEYGGCQDGPGSPGTMADGPSRAMVIVSSSEPATHHRDSLTSV